MMQSEIATKYGVSRQAISKALKLEERNIMYHLLEYARVSGILVEIVDEKNGILVGISPQLHDRGCIILVQNNGKMRIFYESDSNDNIPELIGNIEEALNIKITYSNNMKFADAVQTIVDCI